MLSEGRQSDLVFLVVISGVTQNPAGAGQGGERNGDVSPDRAQRSRRGSRMDGFRVLRFGQLAAVTGDYSRSLPIRLHFLSMKAIDSATQLVLVVFCLVFGTLSFSMCVGQ